MPNQGLAAESVAAQWLQAKGLVLLETNVHCRYGEIDLVMRNKNSIVLVEVKYRRHNTSDGLASVTAAKRRKLVAAAQWLLAQRHEWQKLAWRFDVVALSGNLEKPDVVWVANAFEA